MKDISPDRWKQVESLVDRALDMDPADRSGFLDESCGDDDELRGLVASMLRASDDAEGFLESGTPEKHKDLLRRMAGEIEEAEDEEELEKVREIGPYRVVKRLGRGGMGQVFLAVRDDRAYTKFVAIKVIRRGMDTEDILTRFRNERQILATLNHPNIARLLDGGATEDGRPYFVMDYVDGRPITEYCDEHQLPLSDRLDLFEQVCAAVHYAHQNLVVHRDLKPGNILVKEDGSVKLLDFGIAKFTDAEQADYTLPVTRAGMRIMTPAYASPEQVTGSAVTTASDVYQLGVLLYELLTGHRPFTFETKAEDEIKKIILEKEPMRPSTAVSRVDSTAVGESTTPEAISRRRGMPIERLQRQLSGDLDRIVLMSLQKEAEHRYQSADNLLQDVRRYRDGLPVMARTPTWSYRAIKFVRRHPGGVALTAAVAILLVVITAMAVRFAVVTAEQARRIELEAAKTEQVKDFVVDLFDRANPEFVRGRDLSPADLLRLGAEDIRDELEGQPEVKAEILSTVGLVLADLGDFDDARPLIEESMELRRQSSGDAGSIEMAASLYEMGYILDETGDLEQAIDFYERALMMQTALLDDDDLDIAQTKNDLGVALHAVGERERARTLWNEALATREAVLGSAHLDISETLSNLAISYTDEWLAGSETALDRAEETYRRALEMARRLEGENHPLVASNLHNLGTLHLDTGELDEAATLLEQALAIRTELYGPRHDNTARTINYLGRVAHRRGQYDEAERRYRESLDIHRELYGDENLFVGVDLVQLASLAEDREDLRRALALYREGAETLAAGVSPDYYRTGRARLAQARLQQALGRFEDSIDPAREALRVFADEYEWGDDDPDVNDARLTLGRALVRTGREEEAGPLLQAALDYYRSVDAGNQVQAIEQMLNRAG